MNFFVIADTETVLAFRSVGVHGQEVHTAQEARAAIEAALRDSTVGVVIITDAIAQAIRSDVNRIRFEEPRPLVVEIPSREGPLPSRPTLVDLIHEAVGIRV